MLGLRRRVWLLRSLCYVQRSGMPGHSKREHEPRVLPSTARGSGGVRGQGRSRAFDRAREALWAPAWRSKGILPAPASHGSWASR